MTDDMMSLQALLATANLPLRLPPEIAATRRLLHHSTGQDPAVDSASQQERDYELLVSLSRSRRQAARFSMVAYVAHDGQRRKPAIGRYGEITVEQARNIAQDWLAEVRRGVDPSAERAAARQAPTVKELFDYFISRNKPATVESNRCYGKRYIIPILGHLKVPDVTRADIAHLMKKLAKSPTNANRVLAAVRDERELLRHAAMRAARPAQVPDQG